MGNWDEYVCFVGNETTKALERWRKDWAQRGRVLQLTKRAIGVLISRIAAKNEDFQRADGCFRWSLGVVSSN